jgi:glycosyltransferase involved in cell wall biosynthesis
MPFADARANGGPLKVFTYLHSFEAGGVERDILRFNSAWHEAGLDVLIALGRREGPLEGDADPRVPMRLLQTGRVSTRHWETLWMIMKLPGVIRAWRPDVLVCLGNSYTIVAVVVKLLMGARCPPIVFRVSNDLVRLDMPRPLRAAYYWWLRFQARYFARIVAMAPPAVAEIRTLMRARPEQVVVIDNACLFQADVNRLASARDNAMRVRAGRRWLGIGRLVPQKNFALLIEAFSRIAAQDDQLTIVGEGAERAALEARARQLGIADRVTMPGHAADITPYLADADALVVSSDYEGLGIVVIEALAAGLPVVATDCSVNMASLIKNAGVLVPVRDADQLGKAMVAVAKTPFDTALMRARAQRFTVEATTDRWRALFDDFRDRNDAAIGARLQPGPAKVRSA